MNTEQTMKAALLRETFSIASYNRMLADKAHTIAIVAADKAQKEYFDYIKQAQGANV